MGLTNSDLKQVCFIHIPARKVRTFFPEKGSPSTHSPATSREARLLCKFSNKSDVHLGPKKYSCPPLVHNISLFRIWHYQLIVTCRKLLNTFSTISLGTRNNIEHGSPSHFSPPESGLSNTGRVLMCFSVYTNSKNLFNTSLNERSVPVLNGIRCLSMFWIIILHTAYFALDMMGKDIII